MMRFNKYTAIIFACAFIGLAMSVAGFGMAYRVSKEWGNDLRVIGLKNCAERWSPRDVELTAQGICRVKIDGEWWPESAIKVARDG